MILQLAVRGRLVPQDPADEPASECLKRIAASREEYVESGKAKKLRATPDERKAIPAGWRWTTVDHTFAVAGGIQKTPARNPVKNFYPYLRVANVYRGRFQLDEIKDFELQDGELERWRLEPGDILVVEGNGSETEIGRCAVWNGEIRDCVHQNHLIRCRPIDHEQSGFVLLYLNSPAGMQEMKQRSITTTGLHTLSVSKVKSITVPFPPVAEQRRIVDRTRALLRICEELDERQTRKRKLIVQVNQASLHRLTTANDSRQFEKHWRRVSDHFDTLYKVPENVAELRQAILQLAVQGKLVRQDPGDEKASELLAKIHTERDRLLSEGLLRKQKRLPELLESEHPHSIPEEWRWVRMSDAFDVRDGTHDTPKYVSSGYPLVTSKNLYTGKLDLTNVKYISKADHAEIVKRSGVTRGDVLLAMIGSIGNPVVVDVDQEFSIKNVALFRYYSRQLAVPRYLQIYLEYAAPVMRQTSAGGVQSFVSLGFLRKFPFPLAPLREQHRIQERVDELLNLCTTLEAKLRQSEQDVERLMEAVVEGVLNER